MFLQEEVLITVEKGWGSELALSDGAGAVRLDHSDGHSAVRCPDGRPKPPHGVPRAAWYQGHHRHFNPSLRFNSIIPLLLEASKIYALKIHTFGDNHQ